MGRCKGLSTNHVGLVVEDPDRFITIMTGLFDYTLLDRGTRDRVVQAQVTNHPDPVVDIAYLQGGGFVLEVLCYAQTSGTASYKPRPVDIGHWHLSLNIEDMEMASKEAQAYGLTEVGQMIVVNAGPNKGNKIIYLATAEGVIIELTQKGV
jgi:hypothetical protein